MEKTKLDSILDNHRLWLETKGKEGERANFDHCDLGKADFEGLNLQKASFRGANLRFANFKDANLWGALFHGANLEDADLSGAIIDYASLPISCGLLRVKVDKEIFCQLAYHMCSMNCDDAEVIKAQNALLELANQFCRVQDGELPVCQSPNEG